MHTTQYNFHFDNYIVVINPNFQACVINPIVPVFGLPFSYMLSWSSVVIFIYLAHCLHFTAGFTLIRINKGALIRQ